MSTDADIIIAGAGTAGLTAAIYAKRAGKSVLVFEGGTAGGKITSAFKIENYPGIASVSGDRFGEILIGQAEYFGAKIINKSVQKINKNTVFAENTEYAAKAVIIATGMKNRKPDAVNTEKFEGSGISYCAVCDGPIFKGKTAAVIGGGNSALTEALYLSDICKKVYLIHRRNIFRAENYLINSVNKRKNIVSVLNSSVTAFNGDTVLKSIELISDGKKIILEADAAFPAIGYIPQNELFRDITATDENGFAVSDENCLTDVPGIFVAGDCRKKMVRQIITAAADGAAAAYNACAYIENNY